MMSEIEGAANWVAEARSVVVLTGAGMSAESSVPTFRDAQTGLWERFEPEQLATEEAFRANTSLVWSWYVWRSILIDAAEPNAGHEAIGSWQKHLAATGGFLTVATQNVDDLHERGGADGVLHLHGALQNYRCLDCNTPVAYDSRSAAIRPGQEFDDDNLLDPVTCSHCATGVLRPGVVWFGERLPEDVFSSAVHAVQHADLVVVVGTSGLVQPAASLPIIGQEADAKVIEINPVPTGLSNTADVYLQSTAAATLPRVLNRLLA
ncbi:NAD-dependent deacylase [Yaniella halotolerans]|uniref:NAD-dependent deacylase n=1 Tax=Yaniella halotolerans TaxID=225453 RepID=UPI0003B41AEA|nr:NAD-dependent deacylase [Yaniella halotolerans]